MLTLLTQAAQAKLNLCDVETGQTNIILDIEESRGDRKYRFLIFTINLPADFQSTLLIK